MKDDHKLEMAVARLKAEAPPYKHVANGGPEEGEFVFLVGALMEADLSPVGVWRSNHTGIYWVLPLAPREFPKAHFPACAGRMFADMLVDRDNPKSGQEYRHYKGSLYVVQALALACVEGSVSQFYEAVIYHSKDDDAQPNWVRPLANFGDEVRVPRFKREIK